MWLCAVAEESEIVSCEWSMMNINNKYYNSGLIAIQLKSLIPFPIILGKPFCNPRLLSLWKYHPAFLSVIFF
jgi:hypothetical protein